MKEKEKKQKILIIILLVGIVICMGVTIWALFFREKKVAADYPPQQIESNQLPIEGDTGEKMESPEGGGAINVTYGTDVTVSLSEEKLSLYYANPGSSNQNVAILIMIDDLVVAKSELINPGNEINELPLESDAKSLLQVGSYNAELVVRAYDPESGEKAMVDTNGEILLTVQE